MGNQNSGGHNKKPLTWNNIHFDSLESFANYHGLKSKGALWYYRQWSKQFRGHEIMMK